MQQNWIQLVVVLLIVGGSVVSWVFRKIQEQAALRRAELERERRRNEALRTGRDATGEVPREANIPPPGAPGKASLEELARRRAEQLRELRRLQAAKQRGEATGPAAPGAPVPSPGRRSVPTRSSAPAREPIPTTVGEVERRRQIEQRRAKAAERARVEALQRAQAEVLKRASRPALGSEPDEPTTHSLLTPSSAAAPTVTSTRRPSALGPMSAADWRRAMIVREIFSQPVSLRDP